MHGLSFHMDKTQVWIYSFLKIKYVKGFIILIFVVFEAPLAWVKFLIKSVVWSSQQQTE